MSKLVKAAGQSLVEQLAATLAQRIRDRLLPPGTRLPSVRQCAQQQGVSPSTVVAAYDLLLAQGLVEALRNRGFFVRNQPVERMDKAGDAIEAVAASAHSMRLSAPVNATALIRGMFVDHQTLPQPSMGVLPASWMETAFLGTALRRAVQADKGLALQYGDPAGNPTLRRALSAHLARLAVQAAPEQIVTTLGATQALDVASRTLLRAGDPVMVEEPGWTVEFARLQALGMRVLPVPRGPQGPDLAVMQRYCQEHQPRLFVSVSVLHNPTGYSLSPASAHRILQLAEQYDFHILEDDTYCHFAPEHATRLCALDGLQRTIYIGGFAKVLAPNWRVGFMAAPPALLERLVDTKLLTALTTPSLMEGAMAWSLEQGHLRRHSERVRSLLHAARKRTVELAVQHGCRFVSEPAGMFGWVDTGVDTEALAQRMLDEGYLLAPGNLFHAQRSPSTLMRINFATTQDARFWSVFQRVRLTLQ
ncbi:PLP-dependent aminotransferase family protein [Curvibacter sp. CHRR-16]|uniref:aminotransferase-like domain-containing protein n=1 Tax=Curvibacter sp. CHRR-16 TaxID=2835872 RepID=UPI001BDB1600|nr:PLP-dependent aminotransferase family protein [Curvibacter sp. CHRR-16]MBT0569845.1 PLP-dependent aminotransferase family protein [Curvibacter sp. CHRR-16]